MSNDDTPKRRVRNRKGIRYEAKGDKRIVVYVGPTRAEGTLLDESESGVGIQLPGVTSLRLKQRVTVILRRTRRPAIVAYIANPDDEEGRIGLQFA